MTNQNQIADQQALDSTHLISCPVCGALALSASIERLGAYSLYPCGGCDLHFWHPRKMPDAHWYEQMYGSRDASLLPLEPGHKYFLADPLAPKSGKLLDVGCGTGNFLLASSSAGFEVAGIELDPGAIRFIQTQLHIENVFPLTISDFGSKQPTPKFSVITFFEVLEHQAEPAEFLQAVKSCLTPGGYIGLSVPNRNRWHTGPDVLDYPPNHFLRWSSGAILNFLAAQGFEILTLHEQPAGISYTAGMMNSLFRTGLYRAIAGSAQPSFREVMQMDPMEAVLLLAAKPTPRQRLVAALAKAKLAGCYPLALAAWPWVRFRKLRGTYLYVLARLPG